MRIHGTGIEVVPSRRSVLDALVAGTREPLRLGSNAHRITRLVAPVHVRPAELIHFDNGTVEVPLVPETRPQTVHNDAATSQEPAVSPPSPVQDCPSITTAHDVHEFDGSWRVPNDLPKYSDVYMTALFAWAMERLPDSPGLRMVIQDKGLTPNYDAVSGAMACELLAAILERVRNFSSPELQQETLNLIATQLHDSWTTGRCPQGRTARLYQVWISLP